MTEIKIADLKKAVNRLLDHIVETRHVDSITIEHPYYWHIPADQIYNMDADVRDLDVGSLEDDWEFASALLDDGEIPVAYQLTQIAPLLRYIAETLGVALAKEGG